MTKPLSPAFVVAALKAAAEPTRLRILVLLAAGELTVKDLTQILGQSQPRISRHLKLLAEADLIERYREGSWAYFRISDRSAGGGLVARLLAEVDAGDGVLARDKERADASKRERAAAAQAYFSAHAADWDHIRALHVDEAEVEGAMRAALGPGPFATLVDLGTGTGRSLELFADSYERAIGIDASGAMLAYARANLEKAGLARAQVRQGDIYNLPLADRSADAVVMHQVLHFLADPAAAVGEAARILAPGGRLVIVDFAPHGLEFLREQHAHERLGFAAQQVQQWLADAGLGNISHDNLAPPQGGGDKLTVTLWRANRRGAQRSTRKALEEATR